MQSSYNKTLWIKHPLACWTGNQQDASNGLVVKGDTIIELVAKDTSPQHSIDQVFDASNLVVLPGLINCHHHFYQTLTRAIPSALNQELFPWLKSLYPIWANLNDDAIYASTQLALAELMLSGCTTAADHHYVFSHIMPHAIDVQVEAAKTIGGRVTLTRGSMSLGESAGGLPPDSVTQSDQTILSESDRLATEYHDSSTESMCQIALAPCSPFSVTPDLMRETAKLAKQKDLLLHTHLGETEDENDFCVQQFGMRPVEYLADVGWLNQRTWLAHGIHFDPAEVETLGHACVGICHCPTSNMLLASGTCKTLDLQKAGARVGLGVDGSASNDGSNLVQEVRQAMLLQKLHYGSAKFTHIDALKMATQGSASLLHRPELGEIAVGKKADLALFGLSEARFSGHGDPIAALVLCGAHQAEHVMVAGKWTVRNAELVNVDLQDILARHKVAANRLNKRI